MTLFVGTLPEKSRPYISVFRLGLWDFFFTGLVIASAQ